MSAREWKPGSVALVPGIGKALMLDEGTWMTQRAGKRHDTESFARFADVRPLVVIDPDDREQVQRLLSYYVAPFGDYVTDGRMDHMQAALREFANPKPQEPTDPKARVTDHRENVWRLLADGDWVCVDGPDTGEYLVWWQLVERGPLEVQS